MWLSDLAGPELVDQQRASLRVLPAVQTVQLHGHLVQLLVCIVELGQELGVRPLRRERRRGETERERERERGRDRQASEWGSTMSMMRFVF